jgi:hypothetical protein
MDWRGRVALTGIAVLSAAAAYGARGKFVPEIRLGRLEGRVASIAAAADSAGDLYVAWGTYGTASAVWSARLPRGQNSFTAPHRVADLARDPALAADPETRPLLIYVSRDSILAAARPGSGAPDYYDLSLVEETLSSRKEHPAFALSERRLHLAWRDLGREEPTLVVASAPREGGALSPPVDLGWRAGRYGSLAVDSRGFVHIVWEVEEGIRYAFSRDGGRRFISAALPAGANGGTQPGIAVAGDGTVLVGWIRSGAVFVSRRPSGSEAFSDPVRVSDEGTVSAAEPGPVQLVTDRSECVAVAWTRLWGTDRDVAFDLSLDGGRTFGTDTRLGDPSPHLADQVFPALALSDGIIYAVWIDCAGAEGRRTYSEASCHEIGLTYAALGDTTPPDPPSELAVTSKSNECVTLSWVAPGDDGKEGKAVRYEIRYSTEPIDLDTWESARPWPDLPSPSESGLVDSVVIGGLDPGTQYFFAARAADEAGRWSTLSQVLVDTTVALTAALSSFDAEVDGKLVTLSWDVGTGGRDSDFFVQRSSQAACPAAERVTLNTRPLSGDDAYSLPDTSAAPGRTYFYWLREITSTGTILYHGPLSVTVPSSSREIGLMNRPNPFSAATTISYLIPEAPLFESREGSLATAEATTTRGPEQVTLRIYNLQGQLIRTLVDEPQYPGRHEYAWDGTAESGRSVGTGVYFCRLEVGDHVESGRMIYVK